MDHEIQFGDVDQAVARQALRPDENAHFAVAAYGQTDAADLPIFVDLDVLHELEEHAQSDTSVELGGVLLGGQFEDSRGRPYVVITDSLRATHYESTKGSFKFTHETWSAITRARQKFPPDLQMVGWYHTHPGWGVFLSGMDTFICDNFFNKRLDVAYVIDPCGNDRGMFQWTGDEPSRLRRTGGFLVMASRFRAAELENYLHDLGDTMPANVSHGAGGQSAAPVIHLHQPQNVQPPWQTLAVGGALLLQCVLIALIAMKALAPLPYSDRGSSSDEKLAAALERFQESFENRRQVERAEERAQAQGELLDQVVRELKGGDDGFVTRLQQRYDQTEKLTADVAARDAQLSELKAIVEEHRQRLQSLEATARRENESHKLQIARLTSEKAKLQEELQASAEKLAASESSQAEARDNVVRADEAAAGSVNTVWWWAGGAVLAALAVLGGVWWVGGSRGAPTDLSPAERQPSVG